MASGEITLHFQLFRQRFTSVRARRAVKNYAYVRGTLYSRLPLNHDNKESVSNTYASAIGHLTTVHISRVY